MKRLACILLIVTILVSGLFVTQNVHAQTGSTTISCNTEWTLAQSPINFNGSVTVNGNFTLTIDAGVTVNMGMYAFYVYGALIAQGNPNNQIVFTSLGNQSVQSGASVPIYIEQYSNYGSSSTSPASIIQNAVLNGISININSALSPEIDSCVFNYASQYSPPITISGGSPQVSNNIINYNAQGAVTSSNGIAVYGGTPQITNNQFEGSFTGSSVEVTGGSPVISGNTFGAQYGNNSDGVKVTGGAPQISNNQFNGAGYLTGVYDSSTSAFTVSNNIFSSCFAGINAQSSASLNVQGNSFLKGTDGIDVFDGASMTITGNLIDGNSHYGINGGDGTISSNTISNNQVGIHNPLSGVISGNNIVGNTVNSITATTSDVDAQNNWWGISDTATINRTIYDSKVNPHLGTVLFVPFLTQPSSSAPAIPSDTPSVTPVPITQAQTPQPTPEPVYTPKPTPDQYSQSFAYQVGSMINLNMITTATAVALALVWVVVILGYAVKRGISKHRAKK